MMRTAASLAAVVVIVATAAAAAAPSSSASLGAPPVISGSGKFRYQFDPTKLQLPSSVQLLNGHGLTRDKDGNIYFTYESLDKTDPSVRALIRYAPDGTDGTLLGDAALAQGVPHGIKIAEENGKQFLYHGNNAAIVHKTTLDGQYVWSQNMTAIWSHNSTHWPFKPTDVVVPPGNSSVFVADGYGLSKVHEFNTTTGNYTGIVFGGKDSPDHFDCDHGISFDDRVGSMVISDRSNHRLCWIHNNGSIIRTLDVTSSVPLPCNAQTSSGTSLGGDYLVVPGLGVDHADPGPYLNGSVAIFDVNNNLVSTIEVAKLLGVGVLGHTHPHDAIFLANGDIAIAVWKGHEAGSVGGLEYWRRLDE